MFRVSWMGQMPHDMGARFSVPWARNTVTISFHFQRKVGQILRVTKA
jgi:hypothetical protein